MTHIFLQALKSDVGHFFKVLGERECFRATGDCSIHNGNH